MSGIILLIILYYAIFNHLWLWAIGIGIFVIWQAAIIIREGFRVDNKDTKENKE